MPCFAFPSLIQTTHESFGQTTSEDTMKVSRVQTLILLLISLSLSACNASREKHHDEARKITVTTPQSKAVTFTQQYICQILAHHHIKVRVPQAGYLAAIPIKEGQQVKEGDLMFKFIPIHYEKKAEAQNEDKAVSIKAPFDGVVDRLPHQQDSIVQNGETLTTLSDSSLIWVYFNVPEAQYLEYQSANLDQHPDDLKIELVLASGDKFDQPGKLGAIGAEFKAGHLAFRADFPNPDRLLRHGQTGNVLISQVQHDAIVVPQEATFEFFQKRYVYVVGEDNVAHRREIQIQSELEDLFVVKTGVGLDDKIVLEGIRQIRDGDKVEYEDRQSKKVDAN